jgi:hypothetical protein
MYPYYPVYVQLPTQKPREQEEPPAERAPRGLWSDGATMWLAIAAVVITVLAVALASVAPSLGLRTANAVPGDWTKVLDGGIAADAWRLNVGCSLTAQGMDVVGSSHDAVCLYTRSTTGDLTSRGFLIEVRVAPAGTVQGNQEPLIAIGNPSTGVSGVFTQSGQYALCTGVSSDSCIRGNTIGCDSCIRGNTIAWHSDSYIANSMGLRYVADGDGGRVTLFANGQEVASIAATIAPGSSISLGAAADSEAVFTHATLYSATP